MDRDRTHVRVHGDPGVEHPVVVIAFEGWNDAGDAATSALRHLEELWHGEAFATIDPEEFHDFNVTRPSVEFGPDGRRRIVWPTSTFSVCRSAPVEIVTLSGIEPQMRWRRFAEEIVGTVRSLDASMVLTLGALLADVPHSRPVVIYGASEDPDVRERLDMQASTYQGPTGIVGVLHAALRDAGIASASLWAAVPTYVPGATSPKAALALVERIGRLLEVDVTTRDLLEETREYDAEVSALVAEDDETADFVAELERRYDAGDHVEMDDPGRLVEEVERFLRDMRE
ncbi:MAG: PAC2 family protein [Acidimicrobiales bacterium]